MLESIERRLRIERSLRKAIAYNELKLYYQPQIDIQTNQIVGAEALLRWEHEEYGEISPSEFVPLAEECGLIQPLGEWVFAEVCKQRAIWDSKGYEQLGHIALNISVHQLLSQQHLNRLSGVLTKSGVAAGKIELEITESGLARYPVATTDSIRALRKCGFKLAIDDFGTDYSSLSRLKSFDVHLLKIDQSFVRDMTVDSDDAAIVRAIIEMGHALGLTMLAEGVETREQLELLRQYGCRRCQGFYFGKPVSADEFEAVLRANKLVLAKAVDETPLAFDALDARKPTRLAS
jgi:EAL domain-containing protein (putative c-di-GMP-specific phosphodiesterase class I)